MSCRYRHLRESARALSQGASGACEFCAVPFATQPSSHKQDRAARQSNTANQNNRSCSTAAASKGGSKGGSKAVPAFAFDIDGVLVRGKSVLPATARAMSLVTSPGPTSARLPFVFMTNGGGDLERDRAAGLSAALGVPVTEQQVILAHTPMRELARELGEEAVLVSGRRASLDVARAYGFERAVSTAQLARLWGRAAVPFAVQAESGAEPELDDEVRAAGTPAAPFRAVLALTDPSDWYMDLQLCSDVILGHGVLGAPFRPASPVRVVFAQNDHLWANEHVSPRFGLGAFATALRALHHATVHEPLQPEFYGKPTLAPYRLAERLLHDQAQALGVVLAALRGSCL